MSGLAEAALLDAGQFGSYADLLPPAQFRALVDAFRRELATRPMQLADLVDRGDGAEVRSAAHRLKGAALTIGALRLAALADAIEHGDAAAWPSLAADLAICAHETAAAIPDL